MTYTMFDELRLFTKSKEIKSDIKLILDDWKSNAHKPELNNIELDKIPLAKQINTNITNKSKDKSLF